MIEKIPTAKMSRADWLEARKHSLGGSDMGAVLGMNSYSSPYTVWAEKTGRTTEKEPTEAMRIGTDLEDYVAKRFEEVSNKRVARENYIIKNSDFPHIHANIDRRIICEKAGLECKTASALNTKAFRDGEFPSQYYAQCVTYMAVTGWKRWYLAALILGREFKVYQLTTIADDGCPSWCESSVYVPKEEFDALRDVAIEFWEHIEKDTPPPFDGADATTSAMQSIYGGDTIPDSIDLSPRERLIEEYFELTEKMAVLKTQQEIIKEVLMDDLKDAEVGHCGEHKVTWKKQERKTFQSKEFIADHPEIDFRDYYKKTESRVFRIK